MDPKPKRVENDNVLDLFRKKPCIICGIPSDPCHIKTRGSGGDDQEWNLISLCRRHHTEQGSGWAKFCQKYPAVARVLNEKGWQFESEGRSDMAVWKLRRINDSSEGSQA